MLLFPFKMIQKENVSSLLRLRILGYWGKPYALKRVNAHAERREPSTSVLVHILLIPQLSEYKIQSGRFNVYVNQSLLCYHRRCSFIGSTFISFLSLRYTLQSSHVFGKGLLKWLPKRDLLPHYDSHESGSCAYW